MNENILFNITSKKVANIILNCPKTHNAFDDKMIITLNNILEKIEKNPQIKIVTLKSIGKTFCAGADLKWMQKTITYNNKENINDANKLAQLLYRLYHFNKPILALVQGACFGGGVGLIACCHLVVASMHATFCFSEAKVGLIPAIISPYIIHKIGLSQTRFHFLTAVPFDASKALAMGLCHEIVNSEDLTLREEYWLNILLQNSPNALSEINLLLNTLQPINKKMLPFTVQKIAQLRQSLEGQEGLRSFIEKRKPNWNT